jgi:mono/diheme cytochrome c family protein
LQLNTFVSLQGSSSFARSTFEAQSSRESRIMRSMKLPASRSVLAIFPVALLVAAACSDDGTGGGGSTGTAGSETGASGGAGGSGASTGNFAEPEIVSVTIDPPSALLVVTNGVIPPATPFKLIGTTSTWMDVELEPTWFFDRPDLATPSPVGEMTATGLLGGTGVLQAQLGEFVATADVTVKLVFIDDSQAIDPMIKDAFDGATLVDPAFAALLYPYDKTVFPRGLVGPELQWNGGGAADVYQIHLESSTFEFTTWSTVPPPSRFNFPTAPADIWRLMTNSTVGDVTLSVQRYDGTQAYQPVVEDWKIAPANLAGTIYYWEINQGQVVRLKPGQSAPQAFLQSPPGVTCIACHSVSANGSTMVASFNGGPSPWGTFDVATGTNNYSSGSPSGFQAISPTGSHVVYGQSQGGALSLATSTDVTSLATLVPTAGVAVHPTWSNDGARIAYGARTNGNWLDFTQAGLFAADVDVNAPAFSNQTELVAANADPTFPVNTYPSYSPDSQWLAFQRSNQARTRRSGRSG